MFSIAVFVLDFYRHTSILFVVGMFKLSNPQLLVSNFCGFYSTTSARICFYVTNFISIRRLNIPKYYTHYTPVYTDDVSTFTWNILYLPNFQSFHFRSAALSFSCQCASRQAFVVYCWLWHNLYISVSVSRIPCHFLSIFWAPLVAFSNIFPFSVHFLYFSLRYGQWNWNLAHQFSFFSFSVEVGCRLQRFSLCLSCL